MPLVTQFKSVFPSGQYVLKDGTAVVFMNHIHRTTNPKHIEELKEAIKDGHPQISGGEEVDTELESPIAGLKAKIRSEFLAELAAKGQLATDPNNDMGGTQDINSAFGALTSEGNNTAPTSVTVAGNTAKSVPMAKVAGGK